MNKVLAYCRKQYDTIHSISEQILRNAFLRLDMNGDGTIRRAECQFALQSVAKSLTDDEVMSFFEYLDIDHSGSIDWMEFRVLFSLLEDDSAVLNLPEATQSGIRKVPPLFLFVTPIYQPIFK